MYMCLSLIYLCVCAHVCMLTCVSCVCACGGLGLMLENSQEQLASLFMDTGLRIKPIMPIWPT